MDRIIESYCYYFHELLYDEINQPPTQNTDKPEFKPAERTPDAAELATAS
jgi:hypothetical protein